MAIETGSAVGGATATNDTLEGSAEGNAEGNAEGHIECHAEGSAKGHDEGSSFCYRKTAQVQEMEFNSFAIIDQASSSGG